MKRTSKEWQNKCRVIVYDADGWDRKNYQESWFENKITRKEFEIRLCRSTTFPDNDFKSHFEIWRDFPYTIIQFFKASYWKSRSWIAEKKRSRRRCY